MWYNCCINKMWVRGEYMTSALKKAASGFFAVALALVSGCSGDTPSKQENHEAEYSQPLTSQTEIVSQPLGAVRLDTPVLQYLGSYDLADDEQIYDAKELYLQTYAKEYYDSSADEYSFAEGSKVIVSKVVSRSRVNDVLSECIQSDNSPDLVDVPQDGFSYKMSYMYEDISANMNISAPQWQFFSDYISAFAINSKHYFYPWKAEIAQERLYYNRALFQQYGIADPAEQWAAGEWTWDAFLAAVNAFTAAGGALGVYGDNLSAGFVLSAGAPVITRGDSGEFVSGISSESIERAVVWLNDNIYQTGLYSPACGEYDETSAMPAAIGLAAFRAADSGEFSRYCRDYGEYDICSVPYPRDPESAEGAYSVELFGYLVPTGAKNVQGACCFINCCRIAQAGEPSETAKARVMEQNAYSEEEYEFMEQFAHSENFNTVLDLRCADIGSAMAFENMTERFFSADEDITWKALCEENAPAFERAVAELNALLE